MIRLLTRCVPLLAAAALAACGGGSSTPAARGTTAPAGGGTETPGTATTPGTPAAPAPAAAVGHPREDLIPRAVLFGNPERGAPVLSPDGKMIAYTAPADGVMNVFVAPVGDLAKATQVTFDSKRPVRQYFFSTDSKWVMYLQDAGGDENWHVFRVGLDGKDAKDLSDKPNVQAQIIATSVKQKGRILLGINDRNPQLHDVYSVDVASGQSTRVLENPGYVGFTADEDLKLRQATKFEGDGSVTVMMAGKDAGDPAAWAKHDTIPADDSITTNTLGYDHSGKRYYIQDSRDRDTAALFEVDAATGKRKLLAENPKADAGGIIGDPKTGLVRAVAFNRLRTEWKVIDKKIAGDLAAIKKLDRGDFAITSMSLDDKVWLVAFAGDTQPARYWSWNRAKKKGTFLYSARPALEKLPLAKMQPVEIKSRDGLDLVSYLSLPPEADADNDGKADKPIPMVLLVHGGPWARDAWGYNPLALLLANRGYAVLRVNYRGSTGFGKNFVNAANLQWGKKMHDDLLDAVQWAVDQQVTTADQVCIMGGSYGGYATLAGLTLTPDTFKCGVDIVGPSNLITLAESAPPYWKPLLVIFKTRMGDWTTPEGKKAMLAVSPLTHADKIKRPLLIGQGANDPRVKQAESDQIVKAMQAKGLPVTYVLYPDEGHGFARPENMQGFMAVSEAFLSAHLGGSYQPMTKDDFKGSTIQIKAGAEGIPGLPAGVGR
jgi:dipeptidyl aminopeptidase/acylaminoacyl peptidase